MKKHAILSLIIVLAFMLTMYSMSFTYYYWKPVVEKNTDTLDDVTRNTRDGMKKTTNHVEYTIKYTQNGLLSLDRDTLNVRKYYTWN